MSGKVKAKVLVVVNLLLAVVFVTMMVTVVFFVTDLAGSLIYLIHVVAGGAMLILGIVHIILNFGWIKSKLIKKRS